MGGVCSDAGAPGVGPRASWSELNPSAKCPEIFSQMWVEDREPFLSLSIQAVSDRSPDRNRIHSSLALSDSTSSDPAIRASQHTIRFLAGLSTRPVSSAVEPELLHTDGAFDQSLLEPDETHTRTGLEHGSTLDHRQSRGEPARNRPHSRAPYPPGGKRLAFQCP
jgi:hypothetical protein